MDIQIDTNFSTTFPHFFTVILEDTLRTNKLQIPKKIVKKYGSGFKDEVLLKLPCGKEWKMSLTKSREDGKVWIDQGWPEFSRYYSIARGHFLVFRQQINSQFQVLIFDTSMVEIDYPSINHKQAKQETEENSDNVPSPCPKTREKSPLTCSRPSKRMRTTSQGDGESGTQRNSRFPETCSGGLKRLSVKEKAEALNRASGFKSNNPFFMVPLQPSYVQDNYILNVPIEFAKAFLGGSSKEVMLKARNGRTWTVKYQVPKPKFKPGWRAFAQDNDLKIRDVCVFEMIKTTGPVVFEVTIFRENETTNSVPVQENDAPGLNLGPKKIKTEKATPIKMAGKFQSEGPSFTVIMSASFASGKFPLDIPVNFAKMHIATKRIKANLRVSEGRSWSVLYKAQNSKPRFCIGWREFAWENGLKKGDVCTFKLMNSDEVLVFQVLIVRAACDRHENPPLAKSEIVKSELNTDDQVTQTSKASEAADKFESRNPKFQVHFPTSHLYKAKLTVPLPFARRYLEKKTQDVTLEVGQRCWTVNLLAYPTMYSFSRGWSAFVTESYLRPGDICVFELIQRNPAVFKVLIFSNHKD